jgi:hypothetical protein
MWKRKRHISSYSEMKQNTNFGRAIAQAITPWPPTEASQVRSQVRSCGIYGGRSGIGAGFLRVFWFPPPILIQPTAPYPSIIRGWYNRAISSRRTKWIYIYIRLLNGDTRKRSWLRHQGYKPEGRGFNSRWGYWMFQST